MNFIKKYLPELAVVLAMAGLLLWAAVQTWRLEAAHNQTDRITLAFEQYKLQQQAQMQQERQRELDLKEVERYENEQRLQQIMVERDGAVAERDGVRAELARVRQAAGGSAAGNCAAAAHTIRVLTELLEESDRLAGVYAQYADTTRNHLLTCNGFYNARLHEE